MESWEWEWLPLRSSSTSEGTSEIVIDVLSDLSDLCVSLRESFIGKTADDLGWARVSPPGCWLPSFKSEAIEGHVVCGGSA
jgi:hypothetical protein